MTQATMADASNARHFEAEVSDGSRTVTFTLRVAERFEVRKIFSLGNNPHIVDARIEYANLSDVPEIVGEDATPAYQFGWGPNVDTRDKGYGSKEELVWRPEGAFENETRLVEDLPVSNGAFEEFRAPQSEWFGYKSKYFLVAMKPEFENAAGWAKGDETDFRFGMTAPRFIAQPGETNARDFQVYIGPMELASLGDAWEGLDSSLTFFKMFGIMDTFAKFLLNILHWFHTHTIANYGVAIILLTVVVRLVMLPLTLKSMKSMKRMQALGPELEKIKEKHADDQQELSKAMMAMYRERGVNPIGGCLPMFLQMPIFIALYRMLWNAFELRGAPFLWVEDLSRPDQFIHMPIMGNIPFLGQWLEYFNILPILMGVAMVISMKITPTPGVQNPQQKMMMNIMPVIFAVFCYPLAAGLNLYVLTSTILGIAQTAIVRASGPVEVPAPVKKNPRKAKGKDMYTRAQDAKRQQKKDARRLEAKETRKAKVDRHRAAKYMAPIPRAGWRYSHDHDAAADGTHP